MFSHAAVWETAFFCSPGAAEHPALALPVTGPHPHLRVTSQLSLGLTALWCGQIVTKGAGPAEWEAQLWAFLGKKCIFFIKVLYAIHFLSSHLVTYLASNVENNRQTACAHSPKWSKSVGLMQHYKTLPLDMGCEWFSATNTINFSSVAVKFIELKTFLGYKWAAKCTDSKSCRFFPDSFVQVHLRYSDKTYNYEQKSNIMPSHSGGERLVLCFSGHKVH